MAVVVDVPIGGSAGGEVFVGSIRVGCTVAVGTGGGVEIDVHASTTRTRIPRISMSRFVIISHPSSFCVSFGQTRRSAPLFPDC